MCSSDLGVTREYLTISFRRNLAADDVIFDVEVSSDLVTWSTLGTAYLSATHHGDGTESVIYRSITPRASIPSEFIRLLVRRR